MYYSITGTQSGMVRLTWSADGGSADELQNLIGARYYDPEICRWISQDVDPEDKTIGINPYAYCRNNPMSFFDLDGRRIFISDLKQKEFWLSALASKFEVSVDVRGQVSASLKSDATLTENSYDWALYQLIKTDKIDVNLVSSLTRKQIRNISSLKGTNKIIGGLTQVDPPIPSQVYIYVSLEDFKGYSSRMEITRHELAHAMGYLSKNFSESFKNSMQALHASWHIKVIKENEGIWDKNAVEGFYKYLEWFSSLPAMEGTFNPNYIEEAQTGERRNELRLKGIDPRTGNKYSN